MNASIIWLRDIDHGQLELVGGKAANLGELAQIEGIHVPDGFCVSTEVFQRIYEETSSIREYLEQLSLLKLDDRQNIGELCAELRSVIEEIEIPEDITEEIARHLSLLGENDAYAVRSSATAEDLPTASFAGQQDTYLNIIGKEAILKHIRKCWASLFTERAAIYRLQNGFDHHKVHLAVVVQKMVFPQAAGVLFTADPVTSNRKIVSIDASFGLGEALVSGLVNADNYRVRNGVIIDKKISTKTLAIVASQEGGTQEYEVETEQQNRQTLTDKQILRLEQIGRKIEEHFGHPQDIEWCLVDDTITIVQSRPITTLFPIPEAKDQENHVYVSVGHQQMMTDPIKPLGLSFFLLVTRAPMCKAGGWLFVDVTQHLASPTSRAMLLNGMGQHDPLIKDALQTIVEREVFIQSEADDTQAQSSGVGPPVAPQPPDPNDATIVAELIKKSQTSIAELKQTIQTKSGLDLFDFILADIEHAREILFDPQSSAVFMAAINATSWINQKMQEWLGEKNAADTLSQSVPNNITSEMGLALLDVADALRPYPDVITYLQHVQDDTFLNGLAKIDGGQQARAVIDAFLDQYGMRCAGEIDITRTRWRENPATLIPLILSNVKNFAPGESKRKFEQGQQEALEKAEELCAQLAQLPDGQQKIAEAKHNMVQKDMWKSYNPVYA